LRKEVPRDWVYEYDHEKVIKNQRRKNMADELRFDGRVVIVTGAGAGLGRTYALELGKRGAQVVVNDLGGPRDGSGEGSATPADEVVNEIKGAGGEAVANYDNVATTEGGENIVKTAMDAYGKVDVVVNNAGILRDKTFLKMEPENWDAVLNVHLKGAYCVTRAAFGVMRENSYGRIVLTTSAAGLYGNFGQSNYAAAKMGLIGLMHVLKLEGAKYNINANTIAPLAASRLTEDVMPPEIFEKVPPEFVTPMVVYLCSEQCAVSGNIYGGGMGVFNRVAVVTGPTILVGDGKAPASAEEVMAKFDEINSLEGAKPYGQIGEQMGDIMQALSG
jgi:NAD(P)-dependent dehydrogenase (short-subunit alcohol dehydrogenase family)